MAIFMTRWFDRWARRQQIDAGALCEAVREMKAGLLDANLGGGLMKKRMSGLGRGKRGGFRVMVATDQLDRWFFVFGFAKSARGNVDEGELEALKKLSGYLISLSAAAVSTAQ